MKKESFHIEYEIYEDAKELSEDEQVLLDKALEATEKAYAPHSNFYVGAAVALEGGEIVLGNNQENLAYPSGLCAERTALFYIGSMGKAEKIRKIAIRGRSNNIDLNQPVTPCGACRQVMLEYENLAAQPMVILMQGQHGRILRLNVVADTLVPFCFNIEF